jgi:hypothetical protein
VNDELLHCNEGQKHPDRSLSKVLQKMMTSAGPHRLTRNAALLYERGNL